MKIVGMIPVRLGSKRLKKKALRMLGGKPLVQWVIDTAKESGVFDEIYLNSSSRVIKKIAKENDVLFYKRDVLLSEGHVTSNEFIHDFLENVDCDYVVQINPTSPFLSVGDMQDFVKQLVKTDVLQSVEVVMRESLYAMAPLNFKYGEGMVPSQRLNPVWSFTNGLMGYKKDVYLRNYEDNGYAIFGHHGNDIGYFTLSGFSMFDIDTEEDFQFAEGAVERLRAEHEPWYYSEKERADADVDSILDGDGVDDKHMYDELPDGVLIHTIPDIISEMPKDRSWCKWVINSESNSANLICQMPGEGNRRHKHPTWNEWWYIVEGSWEFTFENFKNIVSKGDIVFIPRNIWHRIVAVGDKPAIRLAVSRVDVPHVYKK